MTNKQQLFLSEYVKSLDQILSSDVGDGEKIYLANEMLLEKCRETEDTIVSTELIFECCKKMTDLIVKW